MVNRTRIGFDRSIHSEWLDAAVARVLTGENPEESRKSLWEFLEGIERGTTNNSGRGKTLTVLTRIWVSVPAHAEPLKQAALKLVSSVSANQRICIHWAMISGTHPFFFEVATHVGKLVKLHGHANRTQLKRRMTEKWGDRETLERTIQHVLKSMTQWELLRAGQEHGSLIGPIKKVNAGAELSGLLAHALLLAHGSGMSLAQLIDHASLFPFEVNLQAGTLRQNPIFRVQRQGDQVEFVELA